MAIRVPNIGEWFIDKESNMLFEVVAIDDHTASIEVQYIDGELSDFDAESWATLEIEPAAAPEDWSASYEIASEDRYADSYFDLNEDPLMTLEPDIFLGTDELY